MSLRACSNSYRTSQGRGKDTEARQKGKGAKGRHGYRPLYF